MSKNVLDAKASPLQDPTTEWITSPYRSAQPLSPIDATEELPAPEVVDAEATLCMRQGAPVVTPPRGIPALQRVTGYDLIEELGRGGMGVVYKAWQCSLQRTVALKMILAGSFAGIEDLQRFRAEAMAIARLHHPHLLNIFEIGESEQLPFYAMEFMEGGSLSRRLNGEPIAPTVAAALLRSLAQAMDYAHKNGIIHRDLKPANILLSGTADTPLDECIAKITDFGIAKLLDQDNSHTRTGDILGTPNYMAPEQAWGHRAQVAPTVDVYSLGAILYELLTGRPPFPGHIGAEVLFLVANEEPERPTRWQRTIPRDLETICLKCLEKDPARRYASAGALADDLGRFLQSEPIQARPASLLDRTAKWTKRRPALATIMLMTGVLVMLGFGVMALLMQQAVERADLVTQQADERARLKDEMLNQSKLLLADAYLERGLHLAEKGDVRRGMHWMFRSLQMIEDAERKQMDANALAPIIRMNLASWGQCVSSREIMLPHTDWVWDVAFTSDQKFVATASKDTRVQIWHAQTGKAIGAALSHPLPVWGLAFHPDGKTLFTICGDYSKGVDGRLHVWSADPDVPGKFVPRGAPVVFPYALKQILLAPHGDRFWLNGRSGATALFAFDPHAPDNGVTRVATLPGNHHLGALSGDGALLATISGKSVEDGPPFVPSAEVQVWDGRTGATMDGPMTHDGMVRAVFFSKDAKHLVVGSNVKSDPKRGEASVLQVWNLAERKVVTASPPMPGRIKAATLAANGLMFAVSMFEFVPGKEPGRIKITDGYVNLWQWHANGSIDSYGMPLRTASAVWSLAFSPDGRMVLAGCENYGAFLWSVSSCQPLMAPIWHEGNCVKVQFSKDGRHAITASAGGSDGASARLWEVPLFSHIGLPLVQPTGIRSSFWESDGAHAWVGCTNALTRWDFARGIPTEVIPLPEHVEHFHRVGDDRRFLLDLGHARIGELDRQTRQIADVSHRLDPSERGFGFEYWPKQKVFFQFWIKPSKFRLVDQEGKHLTPTIVDHGQELNARALNPQGDVLAISQTVMLKSNRIVIYNAHDLTVRHELPLKHSVNTMTFTPDGKVLAFGGSDRQVQFFNVATGKFVGSPLLHEGIVRWVGYLANDRLLATSSEKGLILLWDVHTGKRIGPAFEHRDDLISIAVHPEGKHILTATHGKMALTWRVPEPVQGSLEEIKQWVEVKTGMEMNAHDTIIPIDPDRLLERRQRQVAVK